jgi:heme/copper-type cytochrome/quinol oxidase subunit 2
VSRGKAIVLGIFTAWPILYMMFFMCVVFGMFVLMSTGGQGGGSEPPMILWIIFPLHLLTMLEVVVLLVIYILHVFKTDRVPQEQKALWAVVLFLGNAIAMPVYWYLYIWREQNAAKPESAPGAQVE